MSRYVLAQAKYWSWQIVSKLFLSIIYMTVISEGLRIAVPPLAQKLYKFPFLGFLRDYEETHRLDAAFFLALFVLVATWYLWQELLHLWLQREESPDTAPHLPRRLQLIVTIGAIILGADLAIFYLSMAKRSWGGTLFSFPALVATLGYAGVLVFFSLVSRDLRNTVLTTRSLKDENKTADRAARIVPSQRLRQTPTNAGTRAGNGRD